LRAEAAAPDDSSFAAALRRLLAKGADDPAFTALALTLPGETDLAREMARTSIPTFSSRRAPAASRAGRGAQTRARAMPCLERRHRALYADAASAAGARLRNASLT